VEILVFGAGSLGSLIGGLLAPHHDVMLLGREPHVGAIEESGLRITGEVDATVHAEAVTALSETGWQDSGTGGAPGDGPELAVVTVKSYDTPAAGRALARCSPGAVLSLQNGVGNEQRLAGAVEAPVLAGTCTYGARLREPGTVECTGVGEIALGPPDGGASAAADRAGDALAAALRTTVAADMPRRRWEKLAVNCGINPTTALAGVRNGALVDGPAGPTAREAAREVARVAPSEVDLSPEAAAAAVGRVAETTAANTSSMYQDVAAGERTEIAALNGYVAERSGPTPVNGTLAALVRALETESAE
jgi:2-dehydropantoate 2-reductase